MSWKNRREKNIMLTLNDRLYGLYCQKLSNAKDSFLEINCLYPLLDIGKDFFFVKQLIFLGDSIFLSP